MFADLTGPRFNKRKFRENILTEKLHKEWLKETGYDKDFTTFKKIWEAIANKIVSKVLTERDGVRLGSGLGDIYIGIIPKTKRRPIDYKTSRELGKIVYHENWNTDGKVGKIIYATKNRPYAYRLCKYWGFLPHTSFKDKCSEQLQLNPEKYKNSLERKYIYDNNT
jgi:hypothetical protein